MEKIIHYPIYVTFVEGRYKVPPAKLKRNSTNLGFYARCGNCNYENTLRWCGSELSFRWIHGESYDHIKCPMCGYEHKID